MPSERNDDGLKDAHREAIIAVIAGNDRVERAVLFGSRATGTNTATSDVDIALFGDRLTLTDQACLVAAIDEIPMAQSVDVLLYKSVQDRTLSKHIRCQGVEWYARSTRASAEVENWPLHRFEELLEGPVRNGIYKRKEHRGHGVKIVNMGELFAHPRLRAVPMKRVAVSKPEMERFAIVEGDLLFARRSLVAEGAGKCCVVLRVDEPTTFESSIIRARPNPTISDSLYLYYFFNSPLGLHLLDTIRRQVAVAGITGTDLSKLAIPVPPTAEQSAIAHILGTLDDKIELNRRTNETLEAMARALFKSWFVDFDPVHARMEGRETGLPPDIADLFPRRLVNSEMGEIPEGWELNTLGELCHKPQYGYTASAQSEPVGPQFLRITDINKKPWVSWSRVPYCEATNDQFSKYRLSKGDILIARMADPGHGIMIDEEVDAVFASYLIRFRPVENHTARLLQYWLKSDAYWHLVESRATGTTRRSLNAKVLSGFPLVVPPIGVAGAFSEMVGEVRDRVVNNVREMESLAALRDTLLPKLISGEIRVPDAEMTMESVT